MGLYEPELGQAIWGQSSQQYETPELLKAVLNAIRDELERVYWNNNQKEIKDPFSNTGGKYENNTFRVEAYNWNDDEEQEYNFKWQDFKVSWYKHMGRGMSMNRKISPDELNEMLQHCLKSIQSEEKELF